jgi:hypothetical protein
VEIDEAYALLANAHPDFPRFYGSAQGLDWGVGIVARGLAYPYYDPAISEFAVAVGRAYVVSHECDIDQNNDRPFNDTVLVCPIIPFDTLLDRYLKGRTPDQTRSFISALGNRTVDRAAYVPTIADELPYGGVLYLNAMTHTNVAELQKAEVEPCCAVSAFGLRYIDAALSNAILKRPKAQPLPLTGDLARWSSDAGPNLRTAFHNLIEAIKGRRW